MSPCIRQSKGMENVNTFDCKARRTHRSSMSLGMDVVFDICDLFDVYILEVILLTSMLENQCAI